MEEKREMPAETGAASALWYQNVSLEDAEVYIAANLKSAVRSVIAVGYYLKCVRDGELYREAGFENIWDYARDRFGFSVSTACRYMKRNDRFSKGGNSPVIDEKYKDFNKSQLQEMLGLDDEQLETVTPDMTVQQIREIRKPKEIPYIEIPGQVELSDFPGIEPENVENASQAREKVAAAADQPKQAYTVSAQDLLPEPQEAIGEAVAISQLEKQEPERSSKCLHRPEFLCTLVDADKSIAGNGDDCTHSCCWNCAKHGDCRIECYASSNRPEPGVAEVQQGLGERCEDAAEKLSAYGTLKRVYPSDSLIASEACEGGHFCFSCAMECEIRGEERYCREAPMGKPFPCEHLVQGLQALREEIGDKCQFINHNLADHCAGSGEADPCCKNCTDPCEYICARAAKALDKQKGSGEKTGAESENENGFVKTFDGSILEGMIRNTAEFLEQMQDYWIENMPDKYTEHVMQLQAYRMLLESHEREEGK